MSIELEELLALVLDLEDADLAVPEADGEDER